MEIIAIDKRPKTRFPFRFTKPGHGRSIKKAKNSRLRTTAIIRPNFK